MTTARPDSPGVRFPPPLLYVAAVLVGIWLERLWPVPIPRTPLVIAVGMALTGGWLALAVPSILRFWRSNTSIIPVRPAQALVVSGYYRFSRNPMYVSLALLTAAFGCFLGTWWPIVLLIPTLVLVQVLVIIPEERYLERRFGADYVAYTRRVRRWI
jgi:protein-S-isoprenylcysteine O-methyltransferase Ste14